MASLPIGPTPLRKAGASIQFLRRPVLKVVDNALDACDANDTGITAAAGRLIDHTGFLVQDDGHGIDPAERSGRYFSSTMSLD